MTLDKINKIQYVIVASIIAYGSITYGIIFVPFVAAAAAASLAWAAHLVKSAIDGGNWEFNKTVASSLKSSALVIACLAAMIAFDYATNGTVSLILGVVLLFNVWTINLDIARIRREKTPA